jgi:hypothetical protein
MFRSDFPMRRAAVLALAAALAAACSSSTPTLPPPAVVVINTGVPGAATATGLPQPGVTSLPAQAPSATPPPGATAIPQYGPDSFPPDISPLTGEQMDPALLERIPVAVKISNFPYSVRPQYGLSLADIVFEHLAEAGLTRFTAIFLKNDAAKVGSIRSARYIDAEVAPMFQAVLVTSGSSIGTMTKLRRSEWFLNQNIWRLVSEESSYQCPPLCRERPDDTNTLFANTESVRQAVATKTALGLGRADVRGLAFNAAPPAGGTAITELLIDFSASAQVSWRYNADSGRYTRWQEKDLSKAMIAHVDGLTNLPITAANVVLLQVTHVNNYVPEDFRDGGNCGVEIQIWVNGPVYVFRDGKVIQGTWVRDASTEMRLKLIGADGQVIPLKPGNTWFDIVTSNAVINPSGETFLVTNKVPDTKYGCPIPPTETPDPFATPTETPLP